MVSGVAFGGVVIVFGLLGASQATYVAGRAIEASLALLVGGALILTFLRVAVVVSAEGVRIRNPLSARSLRWSEIAAFRIGRYRLLNSVALVELREGSVVHAFAIQLPRLSGSARASQEAKMIEFLNAELERHRAVGL
jgi:hypothetical protein